MNDRDKQPIKVFECHVDPPTEYVISDESYAFRGRFKVNFKSESRYPNRLDSFRLG
jgi:hypothetical protein